MPWQSFDNRNKTVILISDFIVLFKIGLSHFMKRLPFTSNLNILESEAKYQDHQSLLCNYNAVDSNILQAA